MTKEQMAMTLDGIYNNIYIVNRDMVCIYVNYKCTQNYGLLPEQMIGKPHDDIMVDSWYPSAYPFLREHKRTVSVEHVTKTGNKNLCIAAPVLDADGEIDLYMSINQERFSRFDGEFLPETGEFRPRRERTRETGEEDIPSHSPSFRRVMEIVEKVAVNDIPVLIQGETGTGKTKLAHHIHELSKRRGKPFLSLNCSAIPATLLESELFGYEPYAFTGADKKGKKGLLELADGGTLFLDEIGDMDISVQAKLLSAIESKSFMPIGGKKPRSVDVRILTATNQNLQELIAQERFREDLYWRICVIHLYLPPLRERREDVEPLTQLFLEEYNREYKLKKQCAPEVIRLLKRFSWPGNIRQLKNVVERMTFMSEEDVIRAEDVPEELRDELDTRSSVDFHTLVESWERELVTRAYKEYKSIRKIAAQLQISPSMAQRLVRKYIK